MKLTTLILLALFSAGVNAAGKTAFINSKILLEESPQAIAANSELQQQFGDREQSLRKLAQDIQQMEKTYKTDSAVMSDEQKKKAEDNIIQKKRRFQFEQQSLKEDLQAKQKELIRKVQVSIKAIIQAYGSDNGYDFIFTDASIAYASDSVNITEQILNELKK
ncbi:MAG: OmpH family outer membrane protein [Gammaproteobacteria bacterium]|nr:OmpH family outer membrane protein [Gammaproteobacteria bacterium]